MKESKGLLNLNMLRCPRCKQDSSVETYMKLMEIQEFESETSPIYKCSKCKWIFALAMEEDFQNKLMELLASREIVAETEVEVN